MDNFHTRYMNALHTEVTALTARVRFQLLRDIYYQVPLMGETVEELNAAYAFDLRPHAYQILLLRAVPKNPTTAEQTTALLEAISARLHRELAPWFHELETAVIDRRVMCFFNITADRDSEETNQFKVAIARVFAEISTDPEYASCEFIMSEGNPAESVAEIGTCFQSAVQAMEYGVVYGLNHRYDSYELNQDLDDIMSILTSGRRSKLKQYAETGSFPQLNELVQEIFRGSQEAVRKTPGLAYRLPHNLLDLCAEEVQKNTIPSPELDKLLSSLHQRINDCLLLEELRPLTCEGLQILLDYLDSHARGNDLPLIRLVRSYIRENHVRKVTLQEIADYAGLNLHYLSGLFRKETGETITEYLTSVRLEEAKLKLRSTNDPVGEIAVSVGYEDPHYFSRVFRKNVGVSPQTYRAAGS